METQMRMHMKCHKCGVCCTEISISSALPGMPNGKPAGVPCMHLVGNLCSLFDSGSRPPICGSFRAEPLVCGTNGTEASILIRRLELQTAPP